MTALELTGVTKRYGDTTALDDVSLRIADGEFFTLVGPSGCGKTTTLRLVAGFESPTAGTVAFDGRDVGDTPPERRGVGVVFQNYALFPHMTVGENVAYGLRFSDPPGGVTADERVRDLLDLVDLPGFAGRDPTELSGGQQQRVALARALAPGPQLLLLDEPMSALDAQLRERLRGQVREIQRELGVTTLYVTHDQEEALAISDRVAVLNGGRVEQVAAPRTIYRQPNTPFVASFVGDNNLFEGRVVAHDGDSLDVDVGGARFRVRTEQSVATGASVTVAVRPEHLQVLDASPASPTGRETEDGDNGPENRLRTHVARSEFLGETTRVWLDWNGREVTVRTTDPLDGAVTLGFAARDVQVVDVGSDGN